MFRCDVVELVYYVIVQAMALYKRNLGLHGITSSCDITVLQDRCVTLMTQYRTSKGFMLPKTRGLKVSLEVANGSSSHHIKNQAF